MYLKLNPDDASAMTSSFFEIEIPDHTDRSQDCGGMLATIGTALVFCLA